MDTQHDKDGEQTVEGGSVREAVLNNLFTALNQLQPHTSGARKVSPAGFQTACLNKAGTLLNIWPYFHHGTPA
jgi:hypothetical protein